MNNTKYVNIIYIDFTKAFDIVSNEKLLFKLKSYGISNKIIKLFYHFLSNRSQITRVENSFSNSSIVISGIPHIYFHNRQINGNSIFYYQNVQL